ncbi:MAG: hypothetical protein QG657_3615 [Acidobacteriota bacterium]|nr:hypothetical protein [Acidobacteriota bacterium]
MANNNSKTKPTIKSDKILKKLQTIFAISVLSNIGCNKTGTQHELEDSISNDIKTLLDNKLVKRLFGEWEVVWGAGVFQSQLSEKIQPQADNVMFVAKGSFAGETAPQYIISIAGSLTIYDYVIEDFWVSETVPWAELLENSTFNRTPRISKGTEVGLKNLLNMAPGGVQLMELLKTMTGASGEKVDIIVAGHSLGGALSSTLALYLADTQDLWDTNKKAVLSVVPSAGPAVGNREFADYYDQRLGAVTTRIWNSIDMIPHLFHKSCLEQIPDLYLPEYPAGEQGKVMVEMAIKMSQNTNYSQIRHDTPGLPGTVIDEIKFMEMVKLLKNPFKFKHSSVIAYNEFLKFMTQVGLQHTVEYFKLLYLDELLELPRIKDMIEHVIGKVSLTDKGFKEFVEKLSER